MNSPSHPPPPAQPPLHRAGGSGDPPVRLRLWAVAALVVIAIGAFAGLAPRIRQSTRVREDTRRLAILSVTTARASLQTGTVESTLPAEIRPWIEAPIYARANGYLHRWLVDLGARVEAGQVLAEIDAPELTQELAQAKAQLAQAEAARELSATTSARWKELLKTGSVSEQDAAEKTADLALKIAMTDGARANARRLEETLSFARVTAPFAGVITARRVDVGDLISASNGKELFRLADVSTLRVFVRVPQTRSRDIVPGMVAELTLPESPAQPRAAKVARHAGMIDAASRTLLVELELENKSGEILAGSFGLVRFPDLANSAVLTAPSNTLLFRTDGAHVGILDPNGETVRLQRVRIGRDFGPTIEVLSGVTPSDLLVLNPPDSLVDGMKVHVVEATTSAPPEH
ncbi:MAG: efflux RND transporter periplasmic adaptor subunit [Verrucomicrobia bacterium]|nr:efflux RND transporter periplasmic adaptor subunit [Verrucomicrobiota bacterium]